MIARLRDCEIARLRGCEVARLRDCEIARRNREKMESKGEILIQNVYSNNQGEFNLEKNLILLLNST